MTQSDHDKDLSGQPEGSHPSQPHNAPPDPSPDFAAGSADSAPMETPGAAAPRTGSRPADFHSAALNPASQPPSGDYEPIEPPLYAWPPVQEPLVAMEPPRPLPPAPPRLLPNFGHTVVFGLLAFLTLFGGGVVTFLALRVTVHIPTHALLERVTHSVSYLVAAQAVWYGLLWALCALVFTLWWNTSFTRGVHWNAGTAGRWFLRLMGIGLVTGIVITLAGNFVPIPKATPILRDIKASPASAWALMAFGITLAPLTEELAFRGFLLPSLINSFRWMERRRMIGEGVVRGFGIPLSIVITSTLFALVHAPQVSDSWGPILLIGLVSVILCIVRLRTSSVACGVVVHATYNLMLFSTLLIQTDGFRHLDKLKG